MRHLTTRFVILLLVGTVIGVGLSAPAAAQNPLLFATNTPPPPPPTATPGPLMPEGRIDQYTLPLWLEQDLLDILARYIQQLTPDDERAIRAVELIQYELSRRFPGAPRQMSQREELLRLMLAAPRGAVDMREVVRPYIQNALNRRDIASLADYNGFNIEVLLVNLDGAAPVDAIIHTRYPASAADPAEIVYEDYALAQVDGNGAYRLLNAAPPFPAAPFRTIKNIRLERFGDLNQDGLEEMAISVDDGDVNRQLMIFGWRNGGFISLVEPGEEIRFGEILNWSEAGVQVLHYRVESPAWGCLSEAPAAWSYAANFFRPAVDPASAVRYERQDTLACRLYEAEPLFALPPAQAISRIERILAQSGRDEPGAEAAFQRAQMALAMLYALDGQPSAAVDAITQLQAAVEPGSWLDQQISAFMSTLSNAGATAVDICAALMAASEYGACAVDQVLGRQFDELPIQRDRPILDQLRERGLRVLESTTVQQIGRADRQAFNFDLFGAGWWTFAPLNPDFYTAERIDPPPGFEPVPAPQGFLDPPQTAYDALLKDGSVTAALAVLDNAMRQNPGALLSPAARYLQALCYDLAADRTRARQGYYSLWVDYPLNLWGQLAAVHLERR